MSTSFVFGQTEENIPAAAEKEVLTIKKETNVDLKLSKNRQGLDRSESRLGNVRVRIRPPKTEVRKKSKQRFSISIGGMLVALEIVFLGILIAFLGFWLGWIPILIGSIIVATGIVLFVLSFFGSFGFSMNEKRATAILIVNYILLACMLALAIAWLVAIL